MEIVFVIAILAAFLLGAYIRKPFTFINKKSPPVGEKPVEQSEEWKEAMRLQEAEQRDLVEMMNFTGEVKK